MGVLRYARTAGGFAVAAAVASTFIAVAPQLASAHHPGRVRMAINKTHPTLNVGLAESVYTLNPEQSVQLDDRYVMYAIYQTLFTFNSHYTIEPGLVTKWSTKVANEYILQLRHGVEFSDGTPFNASAVVWNLDNELNPKTNSPRTATLAADIKSVSAQGAYTVIVHLKAPSPDLPSILAGRAGMMLEPSALEKGGAKYGVQGGAAPVGTGPYMLSQWSTPDVLVLVPNPHFYDPAATHFQKVVFQVIPDSTTRVTELRTGQLDVIDELGPTDIIPLKGDRSVKVDIFKTWNWLELALNLKDKPFTSLAVRQALAFAVNRAEINTVAYGGLGNPNPHPITGGWAYNPGLKTYPYNLGKAKSLLAQAGYSHGFTFPLYVSSGATEELLAAQVIQSDLAKVGVKAQIKQMDGSTLYADDLAGKLDASLGLWTPRPDPGYMLAFHYQYGSPQDYYPLDNAQVNSLLTKANSTYDTATRKKYLDDAEQIIESQVPTLLTVSPPFIVAMSSHITGYAWLPDAILRVANLGWK